MKRFFPLSALMCFAVAVIAQSAIEQKLDSLYGNLASENKPGFAIGILQNGKTLLSKGYGLASIEHRVPFTPQSVSDMGSVAKQITDFGIVLLAQQGKLSVNDDIRKYLPEVPDFGTPITISHLIHHTSGLREIYDCSFIAGARSGDLIQQEDALALVKSLKDLNFQPGEQYMYCNTAYMLLADIISRVGEQPFEDWMQANIFQPLGMEHTYIMDQQGEIFDNCADSYDLQKDGSYLKIYDNSTVQGAGGVYTTLDDMLRWLDNLRTHKLGGPSAWQQMLERGILNNGDTLVYAFGLNVDMYRGTQRIQHTGSSAGYRTQLAYFPEHELGIVIKTNTPAINRQAMIDLMLETLVPNVKPKPTNMSFDAEVVTEARTPEALQAYVGRYFCPELEAHYTIELQGDKLIFRHFRRGDNPMQALEGEEFMLESEDVIAFKRKKKRIEGFYLSTGRVRNLWFERLK